MSRASSRRMANRRVSRRSLRTLGAHGTTADTRCHDGSLDRGNRWIRGCAGGPALDRRPGRPPRRADHGDRGVSRARDHGDVHGQARLRGRRTRPRRHCGPRRRSGDRGRGRKCRRRGARAAAGDRGPGPARVGRRIRRCRSARRRSYRGGRPPTSRAGLGEPLLRDACRCTGRGGSRGGIAGRRLVDRGRIRRQRPRRSGASLGVGLRRRHRPRPWPSPRSRWRRGSTRS